MQIANLKIIRNRDHASDDRADFLQHRAQDKTVSLLPRRRSHFNRIHLEINAREHFR